jgi:hypothetical protein
MQKQRALPGVRLRMTAAERRLLIRERLTGFELRQRAREDRRRRKRMREALRAVRPAAAQGNLF